MGFQDLVTWPADDGKIPKSVHTGAFLISFENTFPQASAKHMGTFLALSQWMVSFCQCFQPFGLKIDNGLK